MLHNDLRDRLGQNATGTPVIYQLRRPLVKTSRWKLIDPNCMVSVRNLEQIDSVDSDIPKVCRPEFQIHLASE